MLRTGVTIENGAHRETTIGYRRKKHDEHLAITVKPADGHLIITDAPKDSPLVKQGLLHIGDTILEVNGTEVNSQDELNKQWKNAGDTVTLKVVPSKGTPISPDAKFVRAQFDWDPAHDKDLQCKEIGLKFKSGDVLHIVNYDDKDWWQARKINDLTRVGLVPSKKLHEAKDAKRASDGYMEVSKLSPYGRRVLVLLGAPGVGRRTLKSMLLNHDHYNFATVTPFTSRNKRDTELEGREYNFAKRDAMQKEIDKGGYVEWGEYNSNLYGTSVNSVRDVIRTGRVCVLDCSPQAAKYLYNKEFMPFVVFVSPPSFEELKQLYQVHPNRTKTKSEDDLKKTCEESQKLEDQYKNLIDLTLVNRNVDVTFRRLIDALESLKTDTQWIPSSWVQ